MGQAEFVDRLLEIDPNAFRWVARIAWSLHAKREDMDDEYILPDKAYWGHVQADREVVAAQQGRKKWDQAALARHFEHTEPGHDFQRTVPPEWGPEDIGKPG